MTCGLHKWPVPKSLTLMVSRQPVLTELGSQERREEAEERQRGARALIHRCPLWEGPRRLLSVLRLLHSVGSSVCPFAFPTCRHTHAHTDTHTDTHTNTPRHAQTHTHIYTNTHGHMHFQGLLGPVQCLWQTFQILRSACVTVTQHVERPHAGGRGVGSRNRVGRMGRDETRFHPRPSAR